MKKRKLILGLLFFQFFACNCNSVSNKTIVILLNHNSINECYSMPEIQIINDTVNSGLYAIERHPNFDSTFNGIILKCSNLNIANGSLNIKLIWDDNCTGETFERIITYENIPDTIDINL